MGTLPSTPSLISIEEFLANPLGVNTSKILKTLTTLSATVNINDVAITVPSKTGSAPAGLDPTAQATPSYLVLAGDAIWVGTGVPADPYELVFATGTWSGTGPFTLTTTPFAAAHPSPSKVSIGWLQQDLLSASDQAERFCRQPLAVTAHPTIEWPPSEFEPGRSIWAPIDTWGRCRLFLYTPIVSVTKIEYRSLPGGTLSLILSSGYEVLSDKVIITSASFRRGDQVFLIATYSSGFAVMPDDVKESVRYFAAANVKRRGGQGVVFQGGGTRVTQKQEPTVDPLVAAAQEMLSAYRRVI